LLGGGSLSYSFDGPTFSGIQCSTVDYAVNRPFRLGAEVAWRPFSKNWFTLTGSAGIAATNPFGADFDWATSLYPEYSVSADVTLVYVFGFNATSSYINHMFTQSLGFKLNLRLLELDVSIASSSADFLKSWTLAGATAYAGVKFGF
jgi:outer membrane protease